MGHGFFLTARHSEWLVEELVEDGDEIVCLRVVDKDSKIAGDTALQENEYKQEANALLDHIQDKSEKGDGKAISLILEFAVGKVEETIERMVLLHPSWNQRRRPSQ